MSKNDVDPTMKAFLKLEKKKREKAALKRAKQIQFAKFFDNSTLSNKDEIIVKG